MWHPLENFSKAQIKMFLEIPTIPWRFSSLVTIRSAVRRSISPLAPFCMSFSALTCIILNGFFPVCDSKICEESRRLTIIFVARKEKSRAQTEADKHRNAFVPPPEAPTLNPCRSQFSAPNKSHDLFEYPDSI